MTQPLVKHFENSFLFMRSQEAIKYPILKKYSK